MPYKNPEDKKAWKAQNKARIIQNQHEWYKKNPGKRKEYEAKQRLKYRTTSSYIERQKKKAAYRRIKDIELVKRIIRVERKKIMAREGVKQCFECKEYKPLAEMRKGKPHCKNCHCESSRKWQKMNPHKVAETRKRIYNRIKSDPNKMMRRRLRQRIAKAIKLQRRWNYEKGSVVRYLGCTAQQAVVYLEQKFDRGMTWDNYGTHWHIDHVIPISSYDLSKEEDRLKAFHYTNLQPLSAKKNMRKGAKWEGNPHQPTFIL